MSIENRKHEKRMTSTSFDAWVEHLQSKTKTTEIAEKETFSFKCQKCASCCRNAYLSIFYEAIDIYKLMTWLLSVTGSNQDINTILDKYATVVYIDEINPFPMLAIRTRAHMNSCVFLKSGECSIYKSRPLVCRSYPLAIANAERGEEYHIIKEFPHHFAEETFSVHQYVDKVYTNEDREYLKLKAHYYTRIIELVKGFTPACWESAEAIIISMEYFAYDINKPFIPQYKENMGMLIQQLKSVIRYNTRD